MFDFVRVAEPPYTWRVPRQQLDSVRRILPILCNWGSEESLLALVKETPHTSVYRMPGLRANTAIYAKVYRRSSWRYFVRTPPATRESHIMMKLRKAGAPVCELVAVGTRRRFPCEIENILVTCSPVDLWTLGRWSLAQFRERGDKARKQVTPVLVKILAAVRRMHEAGVYHGDLNPGNILIDPEGQRFFFIDFHRSRSIWPRKGYHRTEEVSELLEYFGDYYDRSRISDLVCAYSPGGGALSRNIQDLWERVCRDRWNHRVEHVIRQCCDNRTFFRVLESSGAIVYMDRQYSADLILDFVSNEILPPTWRYEKTGENEEGSRESWRQAVRKSMMGEVSETPVALVSREPQKGESVLVWDTENLPFYRLTHMFSLDRFDPEGDHFLPKHR